MAAHEAPGPLTTKEILDFETKSDGREGFRKKKYMWLNIYIYIQIDINLNLYVVILHEYRIICIYIYIWTYIVAKLNWTAEKKLPNLSCVLWSHMTFMGTELWSCATWIPSWAILETHVQNTGCTWPKSKSKTSSSPMFQGAEDESLVLIFSMG